MNDTTFVEDLRSRFTAGEHMEFLFFWGHQPSKTGITASCLSQWYNAPFDIDGVHYLTAEHFMMAEKALLFGDLATRDRILQSTTPSEAKALGRQVRGFDEAIWSQQRFSIVVRANRAKFAQHPDLQQFLTYTGQRILVEASPVDRVWGIGLAQNDDKAHNPNLWRGLNLLGFALMQVRDQA